MDTTAPYPLNRMSETDLDQELDTLKARYGSSRTEAANRYEQELAKLFARSGWTQAELAAKVGKSPQWVFQRLTFGRFLNFSTDVENGENDLVALSEGKFRELWSKTNSHPNERARFQAVADLLANEDTQAVKKRKAAIRKELIGHFGDGKWHHLDKLVGHFPDDDPEHVNYVVDRLGWASSKHLCSIEKKPVGTSFKVRIFKTTDKNISITELKEELSPIIEELTVEGKKSTVTMSPVVVANLANQLKRLLGRWLEE